MEVNKILQSDYLDLVFDNRNKNYGGYELRKHYNRRALKALGITLSVLLLATGVPFAIHKLSAKDSIMVNQPPHEEVVLSDFTVPPPPPPPVDVPPPPEPPNPASPPAAPTEIFTAPIITPPDVNPNLPPDMKELEHAAAGLVKSDGEGGDIAATTSDKHTGPFGNGAGDKSNKGGSGGDGADKEPVKFAEIMPEFPGGMAALLAFVRSHVNYPSLAREENIEGKVVVNFIVNTLGEIESARVVKGIGGGCDKEALRVINSMPKWKPGKQNGHAVKVYYTLPIAFKLQ